MDLKQKFNEFLCSKKDHNWVKMPTERFERTDLYICSRCGKQMQILKKERI